MWPLCIFLFVVVLSQSINRDAVNDALVEQRILENIRPILDVYVSDRLERNQNVIEKLQQRIGHLENRYEERINLLETYKSTKADEGPVFTRWGRIDCPVNTTTMVYSGYAGGSHFTHSGAAAEYVCMPSDPIWGPHKDIVHNDWVGFMYGAEYQAPNIMFGMSGGVHDVPCAVCLGNQRTTSLMIPGRTECYPGWTEAYHGDLASGYHSFQAASQYVCVDKDPQTFPTRTLLDENGKLFYGVKTKCGSLPCPPYEDGKFLSCVVCMK
ncbi:short-chain collagen C4-like [Mizuhopecten yessoensis]|uniref:Short-chain collagen C4 n=1 Tax=Mizuhopecten yessoensis TaxID=6573 RepID=A0A210QLF3_MIZYE|nr:short-chain collagen C4-like [Mizuhopecten yessoensis]OWF49555.1 hypothetical protein KP79_PYT23732 [Mizuhopecten yessoensis]